jgi:hypothetical protein
VAGGRWIWIANPSHEVKLAQSLQIAFSEKLSDVVQESSDFVFAFSFGCFPKTGRVNPNRPTFCGVHVDPLKTLVRKLSSVHGLEETL